MTRFWRVLVPALGVRSHWKLLALGLTFPLLIEGFQLVENVIYRAEYRVVDINDVILNWIGVGIGFAVFALLAQVFGRFRAAARGFVS